MNSGRIKAIVIKHLMHFRVSLEEIIDAFLWPGIDLVIWGTMTGYLLSSSGAGMTVVKFLMGGLLLWNIVWRTQQDISVGTLRNVWSGVFVSLFASPLTIAEYLTALVILALIKMALTMSAVCVMAYFVYAFNIFSMGIYLVPMVLVLLIFGWGVGFMITGFIIRYGMRIQSLAWSVLAILNPLCCVFYPLSILPWYLQKVALLLPATYVFEGMRQILAGGEFRVDYFIYGLGTSVVWFILGLFVFYFLFEKARETGRLVRIEE